MTLKISIYHFVFLICLICCPYFLIAQQKNPIIAFASDTQEPLLIEHLLRKLDHNQKATELIFKDIVTIRPASLFILGDVVSVASLDAKWVRMDTYLKSCAENSIPVYAIPGNHDFLWTARKGLQNFHKRFPTYGFTGYSEVVDSVAVLLLNSNFDNMIDSDVVKQDIWYNKEIKKLNDDPAIKFIIVGCHHSPFTNSKVVSPSMPVREKFIPAFIASKKCILFLSGHSHNFERFNVQGKYFLVIGGGGGPHQPLYTDKEIAPDLSATYKPEFHYLEVIRHNDSLQVISRKLKPDFSGFKDGLTFSVGR